MIRANLFYLLGKLIISFVFLRLDNLSPKERIYNQNNLLKSIIVNYKLVRFLLFYISSFAPKFLCKPITWQCFYPMLAVKNHRHVFLKKAIWLSAVYCFAVTQY